MIHFVTALFALLLLIWAFVQLKYRDLWRKMSKIPGPKTLPILGNALDVGKNPVDIQNILMKYHEDFPSIFTVWVGPFEPTVFITDVKYLEKLLTSQQHITKGDNYDFFRPWIGDGLLTSTGNKWKRQRRLLTPTFHFKILEQFVERFDTNSNILVEKLEKEVGREYVDVYPYITLAALDVICETAMGISINAQHNKDGDYIQAVKTMCNLFVTRTFSPYLSNDFIYRFSKYYQIEKDTLSVLHGMTNSVIKKRREELKQKTRQNEATPVEDNVGEKRKVAFLDLLLESTIDGKPLPDEYIREEVDTFMFEGHDTVSSGSAFCLYELSRHPEIQEKVTEELKTIFKDDPKRPATYRDLQEMKYLEMVVKESLRLNPSVPAYTRQLHDDLDVGDFVLPKGCSPAVFCYGLHRRPEYYPDPEKFDPERFNAENTSKRNPYAYLPFSAGPRNCIGQKFALLELKSVVSKVLRNYKLYPGGPQLSKSFEAVLKSQTGVALRLEKRADF